MLGPIFVCTATATGAAATRLTLDAYGLPDQHPTNSALSALETAANRSSRGSAPTSAPRCRCPACGAPGAKP